MRRLRLLSVFTAATLLLTLVACGDDGAGPGTSDAARRRVRTRFP